MVNRSERVHLLVRLDSCPEVKLSPTGAIELLFALGAIHSHDWTLLGYDSRAFVDAWRGRYFLDLLTAVNKAYALRESEKSDSNQKGAPPPFEVDKDQAYGWFVGNLPDGGTESWAYWIYDRKHVDLNYDILVSKETKGQAFRFRYTAWERTQNPVTSLVSDAWYTPELFTGAHRKLGIKFCDILFKSTGIQIDLPDTVVGL